MSVYQFVKMYLIDRYALVCKPTSPEDWTEALRNNFLLGLQSFLELLTLIQVEKDLYLFSFEEDIVFTFQ